jgi:hypothetical protein
MCDLKSASKEKNIKEKNIICYRYDFPRNGDTIEDIEIKVNDIEAIEIIIYDMVVWKYTGSADQTIIVPHMFNVSAIRSGHTFALYIYVKPSIIEFDMSATYRVFNDYDIRKSLAHAKIEDVIVKASTNLKCMV